MIQLPLVTHQSQLFDVVLISPNKGPCSHYNSTVERGRINSLFTSSALDAWRHTKITAIYFTKWKKYWLPSGHSSIFFWDYKYRDELGTLRINICFSSWLKMGFVKIRKQLLLSVGYKSFHYWVTHLFRSKYKRQRAFADTISGVRVLHHLSAFSFNEL